jgi:hypothetical protein
MVNKKSKKIADFDRFQFEFANGNCCQ